MKLIKYIILIKFLSLLFFTGNSQSNQYYYDNNLYDSLFNLKDYLETVDTIYDTTFYRYDIPHYFDRNGRAASVFSVYAKDSLSYEMKIILTHIFSKETFYNDTLFTKTLFKYLNKEGIYLAINGYYFPDIYFDYYKKGCSASMLNLNSKYTVDANDPNGYYIYSDRFFLMKCNVDKIWTGFRFLSFPKLLNLNSALILVDFPIGKEKNHCNH